MASHRRNNEGESLSGAKLFGSGPENVGNSLYSPASAGNGDAFVLKVEITKAGEAGMNGGSGVDRCAAGKGLFNGQHIRKPQ